MRLLAFLAFVAGAVGMVMVLAWSGMPVPKLRRAAAPPVAVTVPLPAPQPPAPQAAPAQPSVSAPAALVPAPEPAPPPQTAALPPPAPPPSAPLVVDRKVIATVQFFLDQLGYQIGAADGSMGRRTRDAILKFRTANNLGRSEEIDGPLFDKLELAVRQLPPKPREGVPSAAPRVPVERVPLSN
jgi:hypothetical protein